MPLSNRARFTANLRMIQSTLDLAAKEIDNLGVLGMKITHSTDPDEIACYASNGLQGPQALLREMERRVLGRRGKRKGRRR